jgi:hypothetical protein
MGPSTQLSAVQPVQRFWAMPGEAQKAIPVDHILIKQCDTLLDAIHLCIHLSKFQHHVVCKRLGIDKGHWSRIMQGGAHFPTNKIKDLMGICGNLAPLQWLSNACGIPLALEEKQVRRAQLMRELELLDAA